MSEVRAFIKNISELRSNPDKAFDLLVFLAETNSIEYFNGLILAYEQQQRDNAVANRVRAGVMFVGDRNGDDVDVSDIYRLGQQAYQSPRSRPSKVDVIKELRGATGLGLKDAKDVVDGWWSDFEVTFGPNR